MGASPYWYFVPHEDPQVALNKLRQREFRAGRYNPAIRFLRFPITDESPAPGAKHKSIGAAMLDADADGTRSILDIDHICKTPEFLGACPVADDVLTAFYGTTQPTRKQVEANMEILDEIERGHAVYVVLYEDGKPTELLFAGYSCD